MGHRVVKGLKWARLSPDGPPGLKGSRPRGAKREGLRYERQIAQAFGPTAKHGQWLVFEDQNGLGWAQPDILFPLRNELFVLEAKYTWVPEAHTQLGQLYLPLLEAVFESSRIYGIVMVKALTPMARKNFICSTMERALEMARLGTGAPVLQWLGTGPMWQAGASRAALAAKELGL